MTSEQKISRPDAPPEASHGATQPEAVFSLKGYAGQSSGWPDYAFALIIIGISTAISWFLSPVVNLETRLMVYLLGVLAVSSRKGLGPSILTSILSIMVFDFFFVPPIFHFAPSDTVYFFTLFVTLLVAFLISSLSAKQRYQADILKLREQRTAALYALSRELASARGRGEVLNTALGHISNVFNVSAVAFFPDRDGRLQASGEAVPEFGLTATDEAMVLEAFGSGVITGKGLNRIVNETDGVFLPLQASGETIGVLGVKFKAPHKPFVEDQFHLLEAFVQQTASVIASDRLMEKNQQTQIQVEMEKLRNSLLSSVSHDLRTPLTAITGSVSSLIEDGATMNAGLKQELLANIYHEAGRLSRFLNNLMEMTRLEAGAVKLHKEPQYIEEVAGAAVSRLEKAMSGRKLVMSMGKELPAVPMDRLLIEQVLINLLDNALKYTPRDTPIDITAVVEDGNLAVRVLDRGPGFPEEEKDRIFEKFYRGRDRGNRGGSGLGLAICRGAVQAHGGSIEAVNRPSGGSIFQFRLPLA